MSPDPNPTSWPEPPEEAGQPKVLLVEDHADMRAYLRKHLSRDYQVLEAARGDDGLELIRQELPDVVVADIMMPGLDGYALCRALKSDPETDFIPTILLTAKTGLQSKLEGLEGGADDYLTKPFEPAELLLRIRNLLRARARLQARFAAKPGEAWLPPTPSNLPPPDRDFHCKVQEVLNQKSTAEAFDVAGLCRELGMSRAQLHRRVNEALGLGPAELIIRFRLERAAGLLMARAGNVSEIAFAVGFKNLSHFVRRFRERYGQTPATFAARSQGAR